MTYSPARAGARLTPFTSTASRFSAGRDLLRTGTSASSAVYPASNRAIYVPLYLPHSVTVLKMFVYNGATVSGNVDVGIYDASGTRLVSKGSTAQAGTSALQAFDITDTFLAGPGRYYMALACDNTTATFFRLSPGAANVSSVRAAGVLQEASAFTLPATMTPVALTDPYAPIIGISSRTIVG